MEHLTSVDDPKAECLAVDCKRRALVISGQSRPAARSGSPLQASRSRPMAATTWFAASPKAEPAPIIWLARA